MAETNKKPNSEDLNESALLAFLKSRLDIDGDDFRITQYSGGSSNLTYLVEAGGTSLVLRRPPPGNTVKSAHDMGREFRVLSKLAEVYDKSPRPLIYSDDESIIGSEFYLMEKREGLILRREMPEVSPVQAKEICRSFIRNLADLHKIDLNSGGLAEFGKPEGYARRQVEGWTKRYFNAQTDDWAELSEAIDWLNARIPETNSAALIHNDYKFDNVILDPNDLTKIVGVLDWEMATVGCPLMDLGTTLGYWADPTAPKSLLYAGFNPVRLMSLVTRKDLAAMYGDAAETDVSEILYYYVFGLFKIAVIAQQIYARYAKGLTKNERFANFNLHVRILGETASAAIAADSI